MQLRRRGFTLLSHLDKSTERENDPTSEEVQALSKRSFSPSCRGAGRQPTFRTVRTKLTYKQHTVWYLVRSELSPSLPRCGMGEAVADATVCAVPTAEHTGEFQQALLLGRRSR